MKIFKYIIIGLVFAISSCTKSVQDEVVVLATPQDTVDYKAKYDDLVLENMKLSNKVDSLYKVKNKVVLKVKTVTLVEKDTIIFRDTVTLTKIERKDSIVYKIVKESSDLVKSVVYREQIDIGYNTVREKKFRLNPKKYVYGDIIKLYNWDDEGLHEHIYKEEKDFVERKIFLKGNVFVVEGVSPNYDIGKRLRKIVKY